jgi:tRNA 2-thiocytidine biosynthesis protein TtcA
MREKDLIRWNKAMGHVIIPKLCGADDLCRREMKELIARMDRETPGRVENIFRSLTRVAPSHLLDRDVFDFVHLEQERQTASVSEETEESGEC